MKRVSTWLWVAPGADGRIRRREEIFRVAEGPSGKPLLGAKVELAHAPMLRDGVRERATREAVLVF